MQCNAMQCNAMQPYNKQLNSASDNKIKTNNTD